MYIDLGLLELIKLIIFKLLNILLKIKLSNKLIAIKNVTDFT